jgi:putative PEP-CTERM system TPR-repeat lipoprotein
MRKFKALLYCVVIFIVGCDAQLSAEQYIQQGKQRQAKAEWKGAIIEFKNAVKLQPNNFNARFLLGSAYFSLGDYWSAAKELDRALELGADPESVMQSLAYARLQNGRFDEALEDILPEVVNDKARKAALYALQGLAHLGLMNTVSAREVLIRAKELDENEPMVRLAWAQYEGQEGNTEKQKEWLKPLLDADNPDAWSQQGALEASMGKHREAVEAYTRSLRKRISAHPDLMRRAIAYLSLGEAGRAQEDIDKLVAAKVNWIGVKHVAGLIALTTRNLDTARSLFLDVLSDNPDYAPTQLPLAIIEGRNNNLQNALSLLEQYNDKIPGNLDANIMLADVLLRLNKVERALTLLTELYRQYEKDSRVLVLLGKTYLKQNNTGQAIDFFRRSIELDPNDLEARMELAQALLAQPATVDLGQDELLQILKINPEFIAADMALFKSYTQQKAFGMARGVADSVSEKHPSKSNGGNLKALTYLLEGNKARAVDMLEALLKQFPRDQLTSQNLAKIYLTQKKYDEAQTLFIQVINRDPGNLRILAQLASLSARQGNHDETMKWLNQGVKENPNHLAAKLMLAAELVQRGLANQAEQMLTPEEVGNSSNPGFILVMAQVKIALEKFQQALRLLNIVSSESPIALQAKLLLAKIYSTTKDYSKLRSALNQALKLAPDNFDANTALARLDLIEGDMKSFSSRVEYLSSAYTNHPDVLWLKSKKDSGDRNYQGAIVNLNKLLADKPHSLIAVELARNHWLAGERADAIAGLEAWKEKQPDDISVLYDLAQYYALEEREDDARTAFRKLKKLMPENPLVLNNLAWLLRDTDVVQGIELAKTALKMEPKDASIMDTLAMLYLRNNEIENALIYSRSAVQSMPGSDDIQFNHALVLLANNEHRHAKKILSRLVQSSESSEIVQKARAELDELR